MANLKDEQDEDVDMVPKDEPKENPKEEKEDLDQVNNTLTKIPAKIIPEPNSLSKSQSFVRFSFSNGLGSSQNDFSEFIKAMQSADSKALQLYQNHQKKQQQLLQEFTSKSLLLMNDFNTQLQPIKKSLNDLKKPLDNLLLNKHVSIPCTNLETLAKKKAPHYHSKQTWGLSFHTYNYYNKHQISDNPHFQEYEIGVTPPNDDKAMKIDGDKAMKMGDEKDNWIKNHLSETSNIRNDQIDIVLKYFQSTQQKTRIEENKKLEELKKKQLELQKLEQREGGAKTLLGTFPWITVEQANTVLEMKDDNIEQAIDYCCSKDASMILFEISEFQMKKKGSTINNEMKDDIDREIADPRVLKRSQTTGDVKCVVFECINISDDGIITLRGVLDRNTVPLDPKNAKILKLSINELMENDVTILDSISVRNYCETRVLNIVFQVINNNNNNEIDLNQVFQNFDIPEHIMQSNDMKVIQTYANQIMRNNQLKNKYHNEPPEYTPISFTPKVRTLEYELSFGNDHVPSDKSLTNVSHRIDGPVLFKGIYDDGSTGMFQSVINQAIEIYTNVIDDVTHNIVCILLDNDMRQDITVDVKNISFTDLTLDDIINDSKKDFDTKDMSGNKLSYRIIVKNKKIIGVLTQFAKEIKSLTFIEHEIPKVGSLVQVQNNKMGIVKLIPIGLIVTNNPNSNIQKNCCKYPIDINSKIIRKHPADLPGYIDVDIIRDNGKWIINNPIKKSYAVTDIKECDENEITEYAIYQSQNDNDYKSEVEELIKKIDDDINLIKNYKNKDKEEKRTKQDILNDCNKTLKMLQEAKSQINNDKELIESVTKNVAKFQRELRTLKFEIAM